MDFKKISQRSHPRICKKSWDTWNNLFHQGNVLSSPPQDTGRKDRPAGFSLVYLPFSDDLRTVPENAKLVEPDPEQVDIFSNLFLIWEIYFFLKTCLKLGNQVRRSEF